VLDGFTSDIGLQVVMNNVTTVIQVDLFEFPVNFNFGPIPGLLGQCGIPETNPARRSLSLPK
jgi:hypothetical protein